MGRPKVEERNFWAGKYFHSGRGEEGRGRQTGSRLGGRQPAVVVVPLFALYLGGVYRRSVVLFILASDFQRLKMLPH